MAPKRSASAAGSPPPSTNPPKAKKPRAPRPKKPKKSAPAKEAKSPPASSPAAAAGTTTGARSPALDVFGGQSPTPEGSPRSRRDGSLAPGQQGQGTDKAGKGSRGKAKERAETAQPPAEGQDGGPSLAVAEQEDQDAEDEVFEFSDDEVRSHLSVRRRIEHAQSALNPHSLATTKRKRLARRKTCASSSSTLTRTRWTATKRTAVPVSPRAACER